MKKVQSSIYKKSIQWFATLLVVAVVLNGAHAKDIAGLTLPHLFDTKKIAGEESQHKVAAELHNHVDKQTGKTFKAGTDNPQLDSRSLRLLRNQQKKANKPQQDSWWTQLFESYTFFA